MITIKIEDDELKQAKMVIITESMLARMPISLVTMKAMNEVSTVLRGFFKQKLEPKVTKKKVNKTITMATKKPAPKGGKKAPKKGGK